MNDVAGITLSKPTTCNETLDVIANLSTGNEFRVDIGATGSPEFRVLGSSVDFYEKFSITHQTAVGAVEQIFLRNPDTDGETITEIGTKKCFNGLRQTALMLSATFHIQVLLGQAVTKD